MKFEFFLSCDWGTTHFRLRLVNRNNGTVLDELKTTDGVARLASDTSGETRASLYAQVLASQAEILFERNHVKANCCVISGMASSRLGWKELPYANLPQPLDGSGLKTESLRITPKNHPEMEVILVSGLMNDDNVMRGEETEIVGLADVLSPANETLLIMPGTHSKHVRVSQEKVIHFETVMTGELYAHLCTMPTLRESLDADAAVDAMNPWFSRGVQDVQTSSLSNLLFKIRARNLLGNVPRADGSAYLSGLLIGTELQQMPPGNVNQILVAADGRLAGLYRKAADQFRFSNLKFLDENLAGHAAVKGHMRLLQR